MQTAPGAANRALSATGAAPLSCELSAPQKRKVEGWLSRARVNLANDQLLSPAENCLNRWVTNIKDQLDMSCGASAYLSPYHAQIVELKRQGRDRYLKIAKRKVQAGDRRSACNKWVARAEAFGGGEVVDIFKQTYCSPR